MDITDENRAALLQRCASGDSAALRTLYDQSAPQLFSVLLRILHRRDLAEEALQEVFMSVWRNASSYRPARGSPMAWLTSIARYRALDIRRSLKSDQFSGELMPMLEDTVAAEDTDLVDKTGLSVDAQRLEDCMRRLTPQQDQAIRLAFIGGFTHEEVASRIGSPIGTIKSWVRRGLQALKELPRLMKYDNPELNERLAAEYVIGTLRGGARRRFEGVMAGSIPLRRAVHRWEQRLFWLSMRLPPVQPPPTVWARIERQIATRSALPIAAPSRLWQALAAGIAAVAVVLGTLLATRAPEVQVQVKVEKQAVDSAHTAIVADSTAPIWVVNAYPDTAQLRVQAMRSVALADNQSFELWMLPDSGAPPVSLGLLPRSGSAVLPVSPEQLRVLAATSKLAVSIEPAGGSPTGAPTGPIPYSAPLLHTNAPA